MRGALHLVFGLVVAGVALWAVGGQRGELEGALSYLEDLKWQWVLTAGATEALAGVGGNRALLGELVTLFLRDCPATMADLAAAHEG